MRSSWLGTAAIALACVPCILVLLVGVGIGTSVLSALGAWFANYSLVFGAAATAGVVSTALVLVMYQRRARGAACEIDEQHKTAYEGKR